MRNEEDRPIHLPVPFLKEGTVLFVSPDAADASAPGRRPDRKGCLSLADLAASLSPELRAYFFPGVAADLSAAALYRRLQELAGLADFGNAKAAGLGGSANADNFDIIYMMPIWGGQQIEENIYIEKNSSIMSELSNKINVAETKARKYKIEFFHSIPVIKKEESQKKVTVNEDKQKYENKTDIDNIKENFLEESKKA